MQARYSDENSVCLSVRLSVCLSHAWIVTKRWKDPFRFLPRCMKCRRGLAMKILSVCLSVCLSVTRVYCDKTAERSVQIFIPYERTFNLVFWEEWLVGATPSTWNFGSTDPHWSEIADFQPIIARSASAVTPSEKSSINANRKSTTCFPMSLRWSPYVAPKFPQRGPQKRKTADFY